MMHLLKKSILRISRAFCAVALAVVSISASAQPPLGPLDVEALPSPALQAPRPTRVGVEAGVVAGRPVGNPQMLAYEEKARESSMIPPPRPVILGQKPQPTPASNRRFNDWVQDLVDPDNTIDLIVGRPRLMRLRAIPSQTQIGDPRVASLSQLSDGKHISLLGQSVGSTSMYLWFPGQEEGQPETVLSFLVRVLPDPEEKARREQVYQQLADEINALFPDSHVEINVVGDKIAVKGQARDIHEATQIIRIVRVSAAQDDSVDQPGTIPVTVGEVAIPSELGTGASSPSVQEYLASGGPNVINLLRVPGVQQVSLKVTVAEINRAAARSIGLNFAIDNDSGMTVFENRTGNIARGGNQAAISSGINNFAGLITNNLPVNLDGGQVRMAINALRNLDYAKSLAEPNLVAINGQTASFQAGGQFPVPVIASNGVGGGFGNLQGVTFIPFGVLLNFTPYVTERDRIRLDVAAEVSVRDLQNGTQISGSNVAGLNTRNFQTTVELRDGQTLAVAGLLQNNSGARSSRVPLFGDLPIAGRLFGYDQLQTGEQELVVLVTPELVNPIDSCETPPLPGSDVYEPGDCEFYLLGRLESRRETDFRSPVRTDYHRMKAYHRCEEIYIAGPHGHACNEEAIVPTHSGLMGIQNEWQSMMEEAQP